MLLKSYIIYRYLESICIYIYERTDLPKNCFQDGSSMRFSSKMARFQLFYLWLGVAMVKIFPTKPISTIGFPWNTSIINYIPMRFPLDSMNNHEKSSFLVCEIPSSPWIYETHHTLPPWKALFRHSCRCSCQAGTVRQPYFGIKSHPFD